MRAADPPCRWIPAALLLATLAGTARPQSPPPGAERVDEAIQRGIAFLIGQQKDSGMVSDSGNPNAMTALALLAASAVGHTAADPTPAGGMIRKGLEYLLADARQRDNGYYGGDGSRMYGHGIVTLTLAELLGMGTDDETDRRIRKKLERALQLILWSQDRKNADDPNNLGGWRYEPDSCDSDLSVTIWHLMALRAAHNASVDVPKTAIETAVQYLRRTYRPDTRGRERVCGACSYQPGQSPSYASAAAGLLAMQVCGLYDAPEVRGAADWLKARRLDWDDRFFLYGTYYYAQGMYQRGGEYADHARREVETILLPKQQDDGSWPAADGQERHAGRVYSTSMAILSLAVNHHYLPIYQR